MLKDEVTMIFHCAATLKLEANLKDAILFNTLGTWKLIELCREMKNLKVRNKMFQLTHMLNCFIHLSVHINQRRNEAMVKGTHFTC